MKANGTIAADLAKGAVAGAAATWVMDRVDWAMVEHENPEAWRRTQSVRPNGKDPAHNMVGAMAKAIGLNPPDQPHPAGIAMHYALAMSSTALYGAVRHRVPGGVLGRGALLGLSMFALEDELMNPMIGAAAPPRRYPWQAHARSVVAHLVLGVVTEAVLSVFDQLGDRSKARSSRAEDSRPSARRSQTGAQIPGDTEADMYGVRFPLRENGRSITVVVSYEALRKAESIYGGGPVDQDAVEAANRHREALEAVARHKFQEGMLERDGAIRIISDDLSTLDGSR